MEQRICVRLNAAKMDCGQVSFTVSERAPHLFPQGLVCGQKIHRRKMVCGRSVFLPPDVVLKNLPVLLPSKFHYISSFVFISSVFPVDLRHHCATVPLELRDDVSKNQKANESLSFAAPPGREKFLIRLFVIQFFFACWVKTSMT